MHKDTTLLGGDPGSGKTTLAYAMALAVATGGEFLGDTIKQGKVLIVQAEKRWSNLQGMLDKVGFTPDLDPYVRLMTNFSLDNLELFERVVSEFRPDFIILDSLTAISFDRGIAPGSSEYATPIYKINEIVQAYDSSCLFIHHLNKNDNAVGIARFRDSSAIPAAVSICIILDHVKKKALNKKGYTIDPEETHRTLSIVKTSCGGAFNLDIELDTESYFWINHGYVGESKEELATAQTMKQRIINILSKNEKGLSGVDLKELLQLVGDSEYRAMNKALTRLRDSREINCKVNPRNHKQKIYTLPYRVSHQMSTIVNQTLTTHTSQTVDSISKCLYVTNDTSPMSTVLSTIQNPYPESVRDSIVDKPGDTQGGVSTKEAPPVELRPIKVNDRVQILNEGSKYDRHHGQVLRFYTETSHEQTLELADVKLPNNEVIQTQVSWLKRRPLIT
jgi:hypothetical protein